MDCGLKSAFTKLRPKNRINMENILNMDLLLWCYEKKYKKNLAHLIFFLLILFFIGCSSQNPYGLSTSEKEALQEFFNDFLFKEGGAYTLFGDKPVTFSPVSNFQSDQLSVTVDHSWREGWQKISGRFPTPLFLLFERKSPFLEQARFAFLVNIEVTASLLKSRYEEFRQFVGFDFDPLYTVFEIEDENSIFWNKVLSDEYFLALILGYGDINGWYHKWCLVDYPNGAYKGKYEAKIKKFLGKIFDKNPSSHNFEESIADMEFSLPGFHCYSRSQSLLLIDKYKKEREKIRKIYRGEDMVVVTLGRLTARDLPDEPNENYIRLLTKFTKEKPQRGIQSDCLPKDAD